MSSLPLYRVAKDAADITLSSDQTNTRQQEQLQSTAVCAWHTHICLPSCLTRGCLTHRGWPSGCVSLPLSLSLLVVCRGTHTDLPGMGMAVLRLHLVCLDAALYVLGLCVRVLAVL